MLQLLVEKFTLVNWKTHQVRMPEAFEPGIPRHTPLNPCFFMPSSPPPLLSPSHLTMDHQVCLEAKAASDESCVVDAGPDWL
jgi:hypothetical protein